MLEPTQPRVHSVAGTPRRRPRLSWPFGVVAGAALVAAVVWWWGRQAPSDTAYTTAVVQRGDIENPVSATGALQPRDYVDVGAQVSGLLKKIAVEVGDGVQPGDLLAEIDAETSQARVDASRAQLRAQAAQMTERELALRKAERDWQRQKNLAAAGATTTEAVQNAEVAVLTAQAQIQSLKAQMDQVKASMRVEEANLKYTRIYAPIRGTVVSINARQGQTLNTNQAAPTLLRVADLSVMRVQAQVSEADVGKLHPGMPVYFTTLGSQGQRWYGQLKKIEPTPTVSNNVVLYNAVFDVPNPQGRLMPQMTAQVFFVVEQAQQVLLVPVAALTPITTPPRAGGAATPHPGKRVQRAQRTAGPSGEHGPQQATVQVVTAPGQLETRTVTLGVSNRVYTEVRSGLAEGERVVIGQRAAERRSASAGMPPAGMGGGRGH